MDVVEEFEKEIREEEIKRVQMRKEKKKKMTLNLEVEMFKRSELPGSIQQRFCLGGTIGSLKTRCYDLKLGSDCNSGKDLSKSRKNDQLVKHKNTGPYLLLYILNDHEE